MTTSAPPFLDGWINPVTPPAARAWARLAAPRHAATKVFGRLDEIGDGKSTADLVAEMGENGIRRGMVVATADVSPWEDVGRFHAHIAEEIEPWAGRLRLGGGVDMSDPDRGLEQLRRGVSEHGLAALYFVPSMVGRAPDDRFYDPFYETCQELGVPCVVVVGIPGGPVPAKYQRPLALDEPCLRFGDLTFVAAHIGYPWQAETVAFARRHRNLYVMTCGWAPRRYPPEIVDFACRSGRDKVIFATDYPLLGFERCTREAMALPFDDEVRRAVFNDNGARVFGFPADPGDAGDRDEEAGP